LTFKQLMTNLSEAKTKVPSGEKKVKEFTVGKSKVDALITKKGSKFMVYIDGTKLDEYKSEKEAEASAKEFADLMGK